VYPWNASSPVSGHNDPNPRNIIFDGERLWLIDWETAFRNDPLTDVAILAENFAGTPELEEALLQGWLERPADRELRARLVLMRQLTRLYYAAILFSALAATRAVPDGDLTAPTPEDFRAAFAEGRLKAAAPETMYTLGKMLLAGFLNGLNTPEFEQALRVYHS
jgi:aminoglycoside phosphotransferase (APT) family kinase protein